LQIRSDLVAKLAEYFQDVYIIPNPKQEQEQEPFIPEPNVFPDSDRRGANSRIDMSLVSRRLTKLLTTTVPSDSDSD